MKIKRPCFEDKLTPAEMAELKAAWETDRTIVSIAEEYRTTKTVICGVAERHGWPSHRTNAAIEYRLPKRKLAAIKADYERGAMLSTFLDKHGVSGRNARHMAKRLGWKNPRKPQLGGFEGAVAHEIRRNARVNLPTLHESVKSVLENGIADVLDGGDLRPEFLRRAFVYTAMVGKFPIERVAHFCRVQRSVALSDFEAMRGEPCGLHICRQAWAEARRAARA